MKRAVIAAVAVTGVLTVSALAQGVVDEWRYTTQKPEGEWFAPGFNDSGWQKGDGGFGNRQAPNSRVGTGWSSPDIWIRKGFKLEKALNKPALMIYHDEDAEVYINGQLALTFKDYITNYKVVELDAKQSAMLKTGDNVLAIHCHQTVGGQFIDAHIIDADNVPKLPPPQRKVFVTDLVTRWGEEIAAGGAAWTSYPRPLLKRKEWQNLNGYWDYATAPVAHTTAPIWQGKIRVPYAMESKLSGVQKALQGGEALWYRREFEVKAAERTLLNFEAVDYKCAVYVNDKLVGEHQGGNTPFTFDITAAVKPGKNELMMRVDDEQEGFQLRGKQVIYPRGIWYTQVSGIWQTVWLEQVGASYIKNIVTHTDAATGTIRVRTETLGPAQRVVLRVKDGSQLVAEGQGSAGAQLEVRVANAKLWSPESPFLYNMELELLDGSGKVVDTVESYTGIRSVGKRRDSDGHLRFTLNGKDVFHWGPLDQGWWPDSLLTPPSEKAMEFEITWLREAGFNMLRKHIKVEPRLYYYYCDLHGILVWQDHVSGGVNPAWTFLRPDPKDAEWPEEHRKQFMQELEWMIYYLESHPSIVCWVPFNEAWGQHKTMETGEWTVKRDPTRHVNVASGGNFWPVGDVVDAHAYPQPRFPFEEDKDGRFDNFIKVVGEFGGHGYPVKDHLWDASRGNWGYGGLPKNEAEYRERFVTSIEKLNELRKIGIAAGVYTQTTDVEVEINGLMTYDRKVIKIPAAELKRITGVLFE